MNIIVVDKCTNYCKYCFASSVMAKSDAKNILQKEDIPYLVDFIARSGSNFKLNILGGEPLLYPHLAELVKSVLALPNVSNICIFTGGIAATRALKRVLDVSDSRVAFLFNVNERADYRTEREYALVLENFDLVLLSGLRGGFGFNIYKLGFDGKEILDLCATFGVGVLRWTVAYPELVPNSYTQTLAPEQYREAAGEIFDFLETAYKAGIKAGLDCPIPKCFFTAEQLGRLALTQPLTVQNIRSCGPVIDVSPNLEVFRCFALADERRTSLRDFRNFDDVINFYRTQIDDAFGVPGVFNACATCEFALDKSCYGGCMAHSPKALGQNKSARDLVEDLFRTLLSEGSDAALAFYQGHNATLSQRPAAEFLVSKAYAGKNDFESAIKHARRAINVGAGTTPDKTFIENLDALLTSASNAGK